jgi:DNA polymerase I-like protein with 3'-5' exonuclease and polymerase domains
MKLLLVDSLENKNYSPMIKGVAPLANFSVTYGVPDTFYEFKCKLADAKIEGVVCSNQEFLRKVLENYHGYNLKKAPKLSDYAGSLLWIDEYPVIVTPPTKHLVTVPYGKFLFKRYLSKLTDKKSWRETSPFVWEIVQTQERADHFFSLFSEAIAIACDIETKSNPLQIWCCGFTAIMPDLSTQTIVFNIDNDWAYNQVKRFCEDTKAPKCFQNGKYDNSYLLHWRIATYGYYFDTANLFHSWMCELPKDLASIAAFCVRESMYWKDLAEATDLHTKLLYNAKDCWNTAESLITLLLEAPEYAIRNYTQYEFPAVVPCLVSEMQGIEVDKKVFDNAKIDIQNQLASALRSLRAMTWEGFNPNSPKQVVLLLKILGFAETSSDDKTIQKCAFESAFAERILTKITECRKKSKLLGTYFDEDKLFRVGDRFFGLYSLNPHGTDTGRLASKEHHFWCGFNVQNQPRGKDVKQYYRAAEGFSIAECDLSKAESWGTAHISGDANLISAVKSSKDFHAWNCSQFFGVPYEEIYNDELDKVIDKALRDLSKRTNHGANYNMGESVMATTMGPKRVFEAKRLLKLPAHFKQRQVTGFLLNRFHTTYPGIRGTFYVGVKNEIATTHKLCSKARHYCSSLEEYRGFKGGWTRYCFDDPSKSKLAENSYVAHVPQSLNAMSLNFAFVDVFYNVWIPNHKNFKLNAQIHDSILFQYRLGYKHLALEVQRRMQIPVTIEGYDGVIRTFTVPADLKNGSEEAPALTWGTTE